MRQQYSSLNSAYWILLLVALFLLAAGLIAISWGYQQWRQIFWHACASGFQNLNEHRSNVWQFIILGLILLVIVRGSWSIGWQIRQIRRFARHFHLFREAPPRRLQHLLKREDLRPEELIYLNIKTSYAFCLGFWQPRVWITAGLVDLLTEEELAAVLAHEAHHLRRRDPLRLLVTRTIKSAFFFLPLLGDLARIAELQQEVEADQAAIARLGGDLPLLCAVQKLLTQSTKPGSLTTAAPLVSFNVTEARLRRLIYPASPLFHRRRSWANWLVNGGIVFLLATIGFLSTRPVIEHRDVGFCILEEIKPPSRGQ